MKKELTPEQIQSLFDFCSKHYVPYYDLQVELVDHLASKIEEIWICEPEILFEDALSKSFGEFGIYGFSKIKEKKQKELKLKYRRLLWNHILTFYKLPKIILTAALSFVIYKVCNLIPNLPLLFYIFYGLLIGFILTYLIYIYPKFFKIKPKNEMKFMCIETLRNYQASIVIFPVALINLPTQLKAFGINYHHWWLQVLFALAISGVSILIYAYYFYVPKKVIAEFYYQFPQMANSKLNDFKEIYTRSGRGFI